MCIVGGESNPGCKLFRGSAKKIAQVGSEVNRSVKTNAFRPLKPVCIAKTPCGVLGFGLQGKKRSCGAQTPCFESLFGLLEVGFTLYSKFVIMIV